MSSEAERWARRGLFVAIFAGALGLFAQNGYHGVLLRDDALYVYSGQQLVEGVPLYLSNFEAKTPLAAVLWGGGVAAARAVGGDDLVGARVISLLICAAAAAVVALLAAALLRSLAAGAVAGLVLAGCWGFGFHAFSGPRDKAPLVLFEALALLLLARRRWFWAAFCASLASLVWQPAGLFVAVAIAIPALQSEPGDERRRSVGAAFAGAAIPWLVLLAYLTVTGALRTFVEDAFLFHIFYLERVGNTVGGRLQRAWAALDTGYATLKLPILIGYAATLAAIPWRASRFGWRPGRWVREDPAAGFLLCFPLAVAWSLVDFQTYPDHYILLPFAAVSFAGLVHLSLDGLASRTGISEAARFTAVALVCALLVAGAARDYRGSRGIGLVEQRQWAEELAHLAGPEGTIVSLGVPQALVLTGRRNPNRFVFFCCGISDQVAAQSEGGLEGWLREIVAQRPAVILLESRRGLVAGKLRGLAEGYELRRVGGWDALVLQERATPTSQGRGTIDSPQYGSGTKRLPSSDAWSS